MTKRGSDQYLHEVQTEVIHENLLDQLSINIVQLTAVNEIVNQTLRMLPNRLVVSNSISKKKKKKMKLKMKMKLKIENLHICIKERLMPRELTRRETRNCRRTSNKVVPDTPSLSSIIYLVRSFAVSLPISLVSFSITFRWWRKARSRERSSKGRRCHWQMR